MAAEASFAVMIWLAAALACPNEKETIANVANNQPSLFFITMLPGDAARAMECELDLRADYGSA
jgi:uncharacterized membrane protein YkgB